MSDEDWYKTAEIVTLLMERPERNHRRWAGAIVFRALETGGQCRYRSGTARLNDARFTRIACDSLLAAHEALQDVDRPLFLRGMLLVPWELVVRSTGLSLRTGKVLEILGGVAAPSELAAAVWDVIESGPRAVEKLDLDDVLSEERGPETGLVIELSEADGRKLGLEASRIEFDRLDVAVSNLRLHNWEANLRPLVHWWLEAARPETARDRAVKALIAGVRREGASDAGRYRLLGLLDWMCAHPQQPQANAVLALGLEGKDGAVRKPAAALAAAMGQRSVLEELVRQDPDKGMRKRAQKLLDDLALDELF